MAQANEKARIDYDNIVEDARKRAKQIVDDSKREAEFQKENIVGPAEEEIRALIMDIASKSLASTDDDSALYDQFLEKAGEWIRFVLRITPCKTLRAVLNCSSEIMKEPLRDLLVRIWSIIQIFCLKVNENVHRIRLFPGGANSGKSHCQLCRKKRYTNTDKMVFMPLPLLFIILSKGGIPWVSRKICLNQSVL